MVNLGVDLADSSQERQTPDVRKAGRRLGGQTVLGNLILVPLTHPHTSLPPFLLVKSLWFGCSKKWQSPLDFMLHKGLAALLYLVFLQIKGLGRVQRQPKPWMPLHLPGQGSHRLCLFFRLPTPVSKATQVRMGCAAWLKALTR